MSHTITSHHAHHSHQIRIPDGTLLDYMVQYRKPLSPQFFLCPKKFLSENNPPHKEFHLPEFATLFTIIKLLLKTKFIGLFIIFRLFYIDF